jgi:DNA polymerase bacteriophage-type
LRPALLPSDGNKLVIADWAAIEARVLPWLAGDDPTALAKLDLFRTGADIYKHNAASLFSTTYDKVTEHKRQVGKVAELACFGPQTQVLTSTGVKAIVDVGLDDLLWDGVEWVSHKGVVNQGFQPTIKMLGVFVTPDHMIRVGKNWMSAQTVVSCAERRRRALATGSARLPYRDTNTKRAAGSPMFGRSAIAERLNTALAYIICARADRPVALNARAPRRERGEKIFGSMRNTAPMMRTGGGYSIGLAQPLIVAATRTIKGITITARGELASGRHGAKTARNFFATSFRYLAGMIPRWTSIESTTSGGTNRGICGLSRIRKTQATREKSPSCKKPLKLWSVVYDIAYAGPRNRFTIVTPEGPLLVHNCGYQGGRGAFLAMARAYNVSLPDEQIDAMVKRWRAANPWAPALWRKVNYASRNALMHPGRWFDAGRVAYLFDHTHLWAGLPCGGVLCYPYARLDTRLDAITYAKSAWKPKADAKDWPRASLYGGLLVENCTQATAASLLRYALAECDADGLPVVLHVHDEIVLDTPRPVEHSETLTRIMCAPPVWAEGLPLKAETKIASRYGK